MLCGANYLKTKPLSSMNNKQRAVFLANNMWQVNSTINIYIYDTSNLTIIPRYLYDSYQLTKTTEELQNYIYWYDFSDISSSDIDNYWDPLYKTVQGNVSPEMLIKKVVAERLSPLVKLNFVFVDNIDNSQVRIKFDSTKGCNSFIGTDNNLASITEATRRQPTMYLAWLDVGTVLHEFGHVLGMIHEHQNPNNNPIQWNTEGLNCYYFQKDGWSPEQVYENVIKRLNTTQLNGTDYDPASIMIYSFPTTVNCREKNDKNEYVKDINGNYLMKTIPITTNNYEVSATHKLSNSDIQWLGYVYPQSGNRDPEFIKNLPKTVIPTQVFNPYALNTTWNVVKAYLEKNWQLIAIPISIIAIIYVIYTVIKYNK